MSKKSRPPRTAKKSRRHPTTRAASRLTGLTTRALRRALTCIAATAVVALALAPVAGAQPALASPADAQPTLPVPTVHLGVDARPVDVDLRGRDIWITYADGRITTLPLIDHIHPTKQRVLSPPLFSSGSGSDAGEHAVALVPTETGAWLFTSHGRVHALDGAPHHGDLAGITLNAPIVSASATPSGAGYRMLAADGGVFTFGDAAFHGSVQGIVDRTVGGGALASDHLTAPIVALESTANGYWLVSADGTVFPFGDAGYFGSVQDFLNLTVQPGTVERNWNLSVPVADGAQQATSALRGEVISVVASDDAAGYVMLGDDGGIFTFGNAPFLGSFTDRDASRAVAVDVVDGGVGYAVVTADGSVFLEGVIGGVDSPDVPLAGSAADVCRPQGPEGFPLAPWAGATDGTLDAAVVFAEFEGARVDRSRWGIAAMRDGLSEVEGYLETVSYGRLDVTLKAHDRWVTLSGRPRDYFTDLGIGIGQRGLDPVLITQRAVAAVGGSFDWSNDGRGFDTVLVVLPPNFLGGGLAQSQTTPIAGTGLNRTALVGVFPLDQAPTGNDSWQLVAAHELLHNLGLQDLYAYDPSDRPTRPNGGGYQRAELGLMGLTLYWPVDTLTAPQSRLVFVPTPDGPVEAELVVPAFAFAEELLGWQRWRLGWLQPSQLLCLGDGDWSFELGAVAAPEGAAALAVLPIDGSRVLVVEARRRLGYDADELTGAAQAGGLPRLVRTLATEGVLAYVVDVRRFSGELPIRVAGDGGDGVLSHAPLVSDGQILRIDLGVLAGTRIAVVSDDGERYRIAVSRANS